MTLSIYKVFVALIKKINLIKLSIGLIIGGSITIALLLVIFLIKSSKISLNQEIDTAIWGQYGDIVGGVVGTLFSLVGTFLIYITFEEQRKQNKREGFESSFFEMLRLHRENVSELNYTKYEFRPIKGHMTTATTRKVFRIIFMEFQECYNEIKTFTEGIKEDDILEYLYKNKLNSIINNRKIIIKEMALIDISFSIVYYGSGEEGQVILRDSFKGKYKKEFFIKVLTFMKLKPTKEYNAVYENWRTFTNIPSKRITIAINELCEGNINPNKRDSVKAKSISDSKYTKYYGGHQHRLGHYYRHLFQTYKYLISAKYLTEDEDIFYGKMLRAQLSTYEQALLFINSISSLGMKWGLTPEPVDIITRYHLIKNLPGTHVSDIIFKTYYPGVIYENEE